MADGYVNERIKGSQHILVQQMHVYDLLWGRSSDPWYVKDSDGKFIYANNAYLRILGLRDFDDHYNVIGLTEGELLLLGGDLVSCEVLNYSNVTYNDFNEKRITFFCKFNNKEMEFPFYFMFDATPAIDTKGTLIGFSFHGKSDFIMTMPMLVDSRPPIPITFVSSNKYFSARELDVIFLLLMGHTSFKISNFLGVSKRTAEMYIHNVYVKAGVKNYLEFRSYCYNHNYVSFVTKNFNPSWVF